MNFSLVNGIKIVAPKTRNEFLTSPQVLGNKLVAMNAEKIYRATDDLRSLYSECVNYPDGIGAVWALKKKGIRNSIKIPGCELWLDFIKFYEKTKTFYLIGGSQEVIEETVRKLKIDYPSISISGFRNGYIKTDQEKENLINDIKLTKPDFVFIAMGSPKQEKLINEIFEFHNATYQGLGGSFDVFTGKVKRAPAFWVNLNLEWAYRLLLQPKRILRQYILMFFLIKLKMNKY